MVIAAYYPFLDIFWSMLVFLPFLGVLVYVIANGDRMNERDLQASQAAKTQFDALKTQALT